jgi:hypothetical protein
VVHRTGTAEPAPLWPLTCYEALRAFFVDGLTHAQAAARFGYTRWAIVHLVREHRAGRLDLFAQPGRPGPPPGTAPPKDRVHGRVIELRHQGLSSYEIAAKLSVEGTPLNRTSVAEILTEEGFGRLHHPQPAAATPARRGPAPRGCPGSGCARGPRPDRPRHPAAALFAGLSVPPKKSALTAYSYRTAR